MKFQSISGRYRRTHYSILLLFLILGMNAATWASRIPQLMDAMSINTAQMGMVLLACGIGAVVSFPLIAFSLNRWGSHIVCYFAVATLALLLSGLAFVNSFYVGIIWMFLEGVACAFLNAAMNSQGARLEEVTESKRMSILHAAFSFGLLASALFSSFVVYFFSDLLIHFSSVALLMIVLIFGVRGLLPQKPSSEQRVSPSEKSAFSAVLGLGAVMFFGTIVEGAMNDWSALYLAREVEASAFLMPFGIAIFSLSMVIGRLFSDRIRDRIDDHTMISAGCFIAAIGLLVGVSLGTLYSALIAFALVGLGMAPVTPCVYAAAAKRSAFVLTTVASMGTAGFLAGPPVIGFISGASSIKYGMLCVALCAAMGCVSVLILRLSESNSRGFWFVREASDSTT
ncbi:MFS transporter [Teredinibacter sp. KSP-S5-2]|uniref:MFS transporter n=1 Tax=Teredinibacter sp. KSP-S5-2 TaxID=3034506 RepID=UPI002934B5BE|nr:MFS transporter [Teredinibacter sp. KSP-S5-2]WNO11114.1 MFS transporter [Teredinibacter sp. KSP-S5-2]